MDVHTIVDLQSRCRGFLSRRGFARLRSVYQSIFDQVEGNDATLKPAWPDSIVPLPPVFSLSTAAAATPSAGACKDKNNGKLPSGAGTRVATTTPQSSLLNEAHRINSEPEWEPKPRLEPEPEPEPMPEPMPEPQTRPVSESTPVRQRTYSVSSLASESSLGSLSTMDDAQSLAGASGLEESSYTITDIEIGYDSSSSSSSPPSSFSSSFDSGKEGTNGRPALARAAGGGPLTPPDAYKPSFPETPLPWHTGVAAAAASWSDTNNNNSNSSSSSNCNDSNNAILLPSLAITPHEQKCAAKEAKEDGPRKQEEAARTDDGIEMTRGAEMELFPETNTDITIKETMPSPEHRAGTKEGKLEEEEAALGEALALDASLAPSNQHQVLSPKVSPPVVVSSARMINNNTDEEDQTKKDQIHNTTPPPTLTPTKIKNDSAVPPTRTELLHARRTLSMELLWVQQAIESRVTYLRMREEVLATRSPAAIVTTTTTPTVTAATSAAST